MSERQTVVIYDSYGARFELTFVPAEGDLPALFRVFIGDPATESQATAMFLGESRIANAFAALQSVMDDPKPTAPPTGEPVSYSPDAEHFRQT